jgi:Zn-dependent protease with chaperone function
MIYSGDLNLNQTSETLKAHVQITESSLKVTLVNSSEKPVEYLWDYEQISTQAPFRGAPLIIYHKDGMRLMIENYDQEIVNAVTKKSSQLLYLFETNKKLLLGSTISLFGFIWVFYSFILPAISESIANKLTESHKETIEELLLKQVLKRGSFQESQLTNEQKKEVKEYLLSKTDQKFKNVNILFRRSYNRSPNAFALSHRTIILTDEILRILNKNEVLAVYFHELGHLQREHILKRTIRATSLAILANIMIGDLTGGAETLATLGATLIGLSFDRKLESEADQVSLELLNKHAISPLCFPDSLDKIQKEFLRKAKMPSLKDNWTKYLQTHPQNDERRERFMQLKDNTACKREHWKTITENALKKSPFPLLDTEKTKKTP